MMDNFVTNFNNVLKRCMVVVVLIVSISASISAQTYVGKTEAIARIETKATQIQTSISSLPTSSLEYRYGVLQLFTYKAIYSELQGQPDTKTAVETVFAGLTSGIDSMGDHLATITEYNKKNKLSGFDIYQPIKKEVNQLLK